MAGSTATVTDVKVEPIPVDEAAIAPELPVEGEVEVPYSIYTNKEKWLIVAMVALAGFYRCVPSFLLNTCGIATDVGAVHCQPTSTSQLSQLSPKPFTNQSTTSTKQ